MFPPPVHPAISAHVHSDAALRLRNYGEHFGRGVTASAFDGGGPDAHARRAQRNITQNPTSKRVATVSSSKHSGYVGEAFPRSVLTDPRCEKTL